MRSLKAGMVALVVCAAGCAAIWPTAAAAKPVRVKVVTDGQQQILRSGSIKVRLKGRTNRPVKLQATSKTFDAPAQAKLSGRGRAKPGQTIVKLPLGPSDRAAVRSCEPRQILVDGKGVRGGKSDLRRNTGPCRPKDIDISRAGECSVITLDEGAEAGVPECMLPFPDNFHTVADETSTTGRRVAFDDAAMPTNSGGTEIDAAPYNLNDGFSPGQTTLVRVPGLDTPEAFAATDPVRLDGLSRNDLERPRRRSW